MAANPPMPIRQMVASVPPHSMASASPRWIIRKESPMACALVVHAVAVAELGPFAPTRIETKPDARFTMVAGMKNGEIRLGPCASSCSNSRSITSNPPIPLPM